MILAIESRKNNTFRVGNDIYVCSATEVLKNNTSSNTSELLIATRGMTSVDTLNKSTNSYELVPLMTAEDYMYLENMRAYSEQEEQAQLKVAIAQAIQELLDTKAQELRYDSMLSARSYAGFTNPFQVEAQGLAIWCANCWAKLSELESLGVPMTTEEAVLQMPKYIV